ncbi:MAG: hypothetical protein U1E51_20350 [Candidatus Binatia bacterium]|nr:hypothetical protein [Candidatus Binatia bacterium]
MTTIDRIKYSSATPMPKDMALLLEYYEAVETWFKLEPYSDCGPELDRLNLARAGLEAQDG